MLQTKSNEFLQLLFLFVESNNELLNLATSVLITSTSPCQKWCWTSPSLPREANEVSFLRGAPARRGARQIPARAAPGTHLPAIAGGGERWYNAAMDNPPIPPFSIATQELRSGVYEHYKGNQYRVVGICRHSETLEELVMYQAMYGDHTWWVRPVTMFFEDVEVSGKRQPRFRRLHD